MMGHRHLRADRACSAATACSTVSNSGRTSSSPLTWIGRVTARVDRARSPAVCAVAERPQWPQPGPVTRARPKVTSVRSMNTMSPSFRSSNPAATAARNRFTIDELISPVTVVINTLRVVIIRGGPPGSRYGRLTDASIGRRGMNVLQTSWNRRVKSDRLGRDDELEHVAVGDPDPTADATTAKTSRRCRFQWLDASSQTLVLHWSCTREIGHQGQHIAGTGEGVAAVHPQFHRLRCSEPPRLRLYLRHTVACLAPCQSGYR